MRLKRPRPERSLPPRAVDVSAARADGSERCFDPRIDLQPELWDAIKESAYRNLTCITSNDSARETMRLAVLFPERESELGVSKVDFDLAKSQLMNYRQDGKWRYAIRLTSDLLHIYPEYRDELLIDDQLLQHAKELATRYFEQELWSNYADLVIETTILFPGHRAEFKLDDTVFNGLKEDMDANCPDGNWRRHSIEVATQIALLFPERKVHAGLGQGSMTGIQRYIDSSQHGKRWYQVSEAVFCAAAIAAGEVLFTDHGLEFIHKQALHDKPVLPGRNLAS